ncbi:hypothetical protein [Kitasatospora sp. NPDC006786]|uniref:hypothetical protein n=1 Tax=unclassified Kitasatospora TaxID=2633591 RepID=UPI0034073B60
MPDPDRPAAPSAPTAVPTEITRADVAAALRSLGLPAELITDMCLTTDAIRLTLQVRDTAGRVIARDNGEPLTATTHIDVVHAPADDAPATGGTVRSVLFADPLDGCASFARLYLDDLIPSVPPRAASGR